ncbi:MAG TPA: B-box zinc finger protein, partial [Candidatus Limnocylindrales bacterium]
MAESASIDAGIGAGSDTSAGDDETLHCYRHPDRETRLRCRTCDRPICPKCAIQTPVGFRCPEDGRVKNDPFTTFKPQQLALAIGIAVLGGAIAGFIANSIGFFSIVIAFFAGGIIVEA